MARDLAIKVVVDNTVAVQKLGQVDQAVAKVESTAGKTSTSIDKLTTANAKLAKTADALSAGGLANVGNVLFTLSAAETTAVASTTALAGAFSFLMANIVPVIGVFTLTYTTVSRLMIAWQDANDRAALKAETAAAKQDVINKALEMGAKAGISYKDAIKYVNDEYEHMHRMNPALAAQDYIDKLSEMGKKAMYAAAEQAALTEGLARMGIVLGEDGVGDRLAEGFKKGEADAKRFRSELDRNTDAAHKVEAGFFGLTTAVAAFDNRELEAVKNVIEMRKRIDELENSAHIAAFGFRGMADGLEQIGAKAKPALSDLEAIYGPDGPLGFVGPQQEARIKRGFGDFLRDDLGSVIVGAFQGGGSVSKSLGGAVAGNIFGKDGVIGQAFAGGGKALGALTGALGSTFGGAIGSIVPGLGTALGGMLGGTIGKLFSNPEKQVNPIRQAFVDAAGGLDTLNRRAHEAGVTLDHLLDAKTPKQYESAINDLNDAFQFQDRAMKTLDDTIAKYGFTLEELPKNLQTEKFQAWAGGLIQDYSVLNTAGFDQNEIVKKMSGSFNDLAKTSLITGQAIPENLKPAYQRMIDLGLAVDNNGDKLTDIGQLQFAKSLGEQFDTLLGKIDKLVDAITRGLGGAIRSVPNLHVPVAIDNPDFGAREFHQGGPILPFVPRAHRGLAIDEVPIIAQTGEGILNRGAMRRIGGSRGLNALNAGGGGGSTVNVNVNVTGGVIDDEKTQRALARVIRKQITNDLYARVRVGAA
jgi:hypothetical protein